MRLEDGETDNGKQKEWSESLAKSCLEKDTVEAPRRVNRGGCPSASLRLLSPRPHAASLKSLHTCKPDAQGTSGVVHTSWTTQLWMTQHKPGNWTDKTMSTFLKMPGILNRSSSQVTLRDTFLIDTHNYVKKERKKKSPVAWHSSKESCRVFVHVDICSNWQLLLSYSWFRFWSLC